MSSSVFAALSKRTRQGIRLARRSWVSGKLRHGFDLGGGLSGAYFVTTDRGVLWLEGERGRLLTARRGYGLAFIAGMAYFTVDTKGASRIMCVPIEKFTKGISANRVARCVCEVPITSTNERIHQITSTSDGALLVANTARNSLVRIDPESGTYDEVTPFPDRFGAPIDMDHNHINSVIEYGGTTFFVAYKAGQRSFIGYIDGQDVLGWFYENAGIHGLYNTNTGFLVFDTFGGKSERGKILTERGEYLTEFTDRGDGYALRGAAGTQDEVVIGHSHKGPRSTRYMGNGGLIVAHKSSTAYIQLPVAQVYQVRRADGAYFDDELAGDLITGLSNRFGAPERVASVKSLAGNW